jgi:hypothetical protein
MKRRKCPICKRIIPLNPLGTNIVGEAVLEFHIQLTSKRECPGSDRSPESVKRGIEIAAEVKRYTT